MKHFYTILLLTTIPIFVCANAHSVIVIPQQDFTVYEGDTVNAVDERGKKQGYWIIWGRMVSADDYKPDQKVEEGPYKSNRKNGLWTKYYPNEQIWSEITFVNNRPNGPYKTYFRNGQLEEAGEWKRNKNIKTFKRYHKNGNVAQEFTFTDSGLRDGVQKIYHENGQLEVEFSVKDGKEDGELKRYYPNGDLKEVKVFNNGELDESSVKTFEPKKPIVEKAPEEVEKPVRVSKKTSDDKPNPVKVFDGEGDHTLYNRNRQISQQGFFQGGRLKNGKKYIYNDDGILEAIEMYKNFKYIGDTPIEED